jgi:hypothetical protein
MTRAPQSRRWNGQRFVEHVGDGIADWRWASGELNRMRARVWELAEVLDGMDGETVQQRWSAFEGTVWSEWVAGRGRPGGDLWRWGTWGAVLTRSVQPGWPLMSTGRIGQWTDRLPADHFVRLGSSRLRELLAGLPWVDDGAREHAMAGTTPDAGAQSRWHRAVDR